MSRSVIVSCALIIGTAALAQQAPEFRSRVNTVSVYTTVTDRDGRLMPGLVKDDFEAFDNGKRQELTHFVDEVQPITVVVMLDRSGSTVRSFDIVRSAAEHFVATLLDVDKARIGHFGSRVEINPPSFTSDTSELTRILQEDLQAAGATTPLWDAAADGIKALSDQAGRRVVLLFTDGFDNPGSAGTHAGFENVRDRSRSDGVMVYGIGLIEGCDQPGTPVMTTDEDIRLQARGRPACG